MKKEFEIPDGYEAKIEGNKVVFVPKESEDERIRSLLVWQVHRNIEDETNDLAGSVYDGIKGHDPDLEESIEDWKKCLAYLERQKDEAQKQFNLGIQAGKEEAMYEMKPLSTEETELNSIALLEHLGYTCVPPGAERKPAELSEEDMENVELIADHLDNLGNTAMAEFLRNLRPQPHWKPRPEQMRYLLAVINEPNNAGAESCRIALQSLYRDLKNL